MSNNKNMILSINLDENISHDVFPDFDDIVPETALALLLLGDYVFMLPIDRALDGLSYCSIFVNVSDTFYTACSDSQVVKFFPQKHSREYFSFKKLYNYIKDYGDIGRVLWAIEERMQAPLYKVKIKIKELGLWKEEYDGYT